VGVGVAVEAEEVEVEGAVVEMAQCILRPNCCHSSEKQLDQRQDCDQHSWHARMSSSLCNMLNMVTHDNACRNVMAGE